MLKGAISTEIKYTYIESSLLLLTWQSVRLNRMIADSGNDIGRPLFYYDLASTKSIKTCISNYYPTSIKLLFKHFNKKRVGYLLIDYRHD